MSKYLYIFRIFDHEAGSEPGKGKQSDLQMYTIEADSPEQADKEAAKSANSSAQMGARTIQAERVTEIGGDVDSMLLAYSTLRLERECTLCNDVEVSVVGYPEACNLAQKVNAIQHEIALRFTQGEEPKDYELIAISCMSDQPLVDW